MTNEKIRQVYLNWKGLELIRSIKSIFYVILFVLSVIFLFVSMSTQSYFIFGISLILLFLQLSENNKEYSLKYQELFERLKSKDKLTKSDEEWIKFLGKTKGLNSFNLWIVGKLTFNKKFEKERDNEN